MPVVKKGDKVLAGQKIAEAGGFVSAPIYATVSGTVKTIEPRRVVTGDLVNSIIIDNDGLLEEVEYTAHDPEKLNKKEILELIKEAGVVGMGGAGFPTHVKLSPKSRKNRVCDSKLCGVRTISDVGLPQNAGGAAEADQRTEDHSSVI